MPQECTHLGCPALNLQQRVCSNPRELNFQDVSLAAQKIHLAIKVVSPPLPGSLSHTAFPVWLYKNVVPSLLLQETVTNLHVQEFLCSTACPPFHSTAPHSTAPHLEVWEQPMTLLSFCCVFSLQNIIHHYFFQMRQKTEERIH